MVLEEFDNQISKLSPCPFIGVATNATKIVICSIDDRVSSEHALAELTISFAAHSKFGINCKAVQLVDDKICGRLLVGDQAHNISKSFIVNASVYFSKLRGTVGTCYCSN